MLKEFNKPKDFESFLYVSQVLQAEGIKFALEGHRRAAPYCMGSLYWQLNDVWPVASWSSTDYFQKWKALQYYVKKGFEPVLVSPYLSEDEIRVNMINDRLSELKGILRLKVTDFYGHSVFRFETETMVPANSNMTVFSEQQMKLFENRDPAELMLVAEFVVNDTVCLSNVLYFKPFKELKLPKPEIAHTYRKTENGFIIGLSSNSLARNVCLQLENEPGFFSDNYFDLLPGLKVEIELQTSVTETRLNEVFRIRTLSDAF
jgi:beta-mannosidase